MNETICERINPRIIIMMLHDKTWETLCKLDKTKYSPVQESHYNWNITLYKIYPCRGLIFKKTHIKVAVFYPDTSDVWVFKKDSYDFIKKLGKELGYGTITKNWREE